MQGVEILNEVAKSEMIGITSICFSISFIISSGFFISLIATFVSTLWWSRIESVFLGLILTFALSAILLFNYGERDYWTEYEVVISDDVKMVEFIKKYEIIDQDGKIFTVREVE